MAPKYKPIYQEPDYQYVFTIRLLGIFLDIYQNDTHVLARYDEMPDNTLIMPKSRKEYFKNMKEEKMWNPIFMSLEVIEKFEKNKESSVE